MGPNTKNNATFTDEFLLNRAKTNLRKLDVIGITENLNDMISQLRFHLQLVYPGFKTWPEANEIKVEKKSEIDLEAREILRKWSWADHALYEEALKLSKVKTELAKSCINKP